MLYEVITCDEPFSNAVVVDVFNDAAATVSASATQVCLNEVVTLVAAPTGGSPAMAYHWQVSLDGSTGWTDVGVSNADYIPVITSYSIHYTKLYEC